YALRDTTGTVPAIPLIASSVMSKKIAAGANAVVLDVKVGSGAFMKDLASARELARAMVSIGVAHGLAVTCELTDMEQPLGRAVGNSLEIAEAIATLRGEGPADLVQLTRAAGAEMLVRGRRARDRKSAVARIDRALADGSGVAKFRELVAAQGGDVTQVDDPSKLPRAPKVETLRAARTAYVAAIAADQVGIASVRLGAGREKKGEPIDHRTGIDGLALLFSAGTQADRSDADLVRGDRRDVCGACGAQRLHLRRARELRRIVHLRDVAALRGDELAKLGDATPVGESAVDARDCRLPVARPAAAHEHLGAGRAGQLHQIGWAFAAQRCDGLGDLEAVAHSAAQRLLHIRELARDRQAVRDADRDHRACELACGGEVLHEGPTPDLH